MECAFVGRAINRPFGAQQRDALASLRLGARGDDAANVQAGQRIRLGRGVERDVGGVVRADEKIATRRREPLGGAHQMRVDRGKIARLPSF